MESPDLNTAPNVASGRIPSEESKLTEQFRNQSMIMKPRDHPLNPAKNSSNCTLLVIDASMTEATSNHNVARVSSGTGHNNLPNGTGHKQDSEDQKQTLSSFVGRIGRRKVDSEGKTTWISQKDWEEEERISNAQQSSFDFCLDDSNKKIKIKIMSSKLIDVIKKIIPPSFFKSTPDSVSFQEPYAPLFRYSEDIQQELESLETSSSEVSGVFYALRSFLDSQTGYGTVWKSLDRGNQAVVSFENLWALFRTGELIVLQDQLEEKRLFVFTRMEEVIVEVGLQKDYCAAIHVHFWYIVWSTGEKKFRQNSQYIKVDSFSGRRDVTSLPIYPLRHENKDLRESLRNDLQTRRRTWSNLVSNPPSCFEHSGRAMPEEEDGVRGNENLMHIQGRVILDQKDSWNIITDVKLGNSSREVDQKLNGSWNITRRLKLSNPEHFLLCPPQIGCYRVESGRRYLVNVNKLDPVKWSSSTMNQLVLDKDKKDLLKALVSNVDELRSKSGDIIANKGRGLTIVLHGPSGVGKTLTAECMAEYAKKPLIPLSVGNLVAVEDSIEERLTEAFANANRLGAILLLDEADVVLEARSFKDVRRNGIVSVFLRQLEYYSGILFLTTNRINSMDPAFQSRVQIFVSYSTVGKKQRQDIWGNLLNSTLVGCAEEDKAIIEEHIEEFAEHQLNGRQIRNTLRMSAFAAAADMASNRKVQLKHIKKALADAVRTQEYFEEGKTDLKNKNRHWKPFAPTQARSYT